MRESRYKERWLKNLGHYLARDQERVEGALPSAKEFLGALASWAGKGRDELLQVICREIGQATAAVLREPLTQLLHQKKLQITIELLTSEETAKTKPSKPRAGARKVRKRRSSEPQHA
jgi:hypothetical protein